MENHERKRILLLITNLTFGGAQRVFHQHAELLSKEHEVIECVFNINDGKPAFLTGNRLISLDVKAGTNSIDKIYRFCQRVLRLRKIKKQFDVDYCISHLEGADLVNVLSRGKEKVITWVHGSKKFDENLFGFFGRLRHNVLIPFTYRMADSVFTVSNGIRNELIEYYHVKPSNVKTLRNFFDVDRIKRLAAEEIPPQFQYLFQERPVIIFSGRLARQKNPIALIRWFAEFKKQNNARLMIVGDGELFDSMLQTCSDVNLTYSSPRGSTASNGQEHVTFLGFQENPFRFIARATCFVLSSRWEGFPMAIGEAMACGCPVVSSDCPTGPLELLIENPDSEERSYPMYGRYGILVPILDEQTNATWTDACEKLMGSDEMLRDYKHNGLERVRQFSFELNYQKVLDIVRN